ncbi:hypothetical protein ACFV06_21285 [Streptomyces sp. NPDC059618]|uniref:hypothetical protein n=1 Tax=Streptomyces sp. NPDC059618 TaxID=3346887 RepID=UPI0036B5A7E7
MISDIAGIATAVGVLLAVAGLRQGQRQRIRAFEDFYVSRYWLLMDRLSLRASTGHDSDDELGKGDQKALLAYLSLCEDELDLRASGWISDATWDIWRKGIRTQLDHWPASKVWSQAQQAAEQGHGQAFTQLRQFMSSSSEGDDPCELSGWTRRLRGLRGWIVP